MDIGVSSLLEGGVEEVLEVLDPWDCDAFAWEGVGVCEGDAEHFGEALFL